MKKYAAVILALVLSNAALAKVVYAPKQVHVPFVNQVVNSGDYRGLYVNYNMNSNPAQQVVCTLSDFYKGWIDYSDNQVANESNTYGDAQTVIFTKKGKTQYISETLDQFHADAVGHVLISHLDSNNKKQTAAFVSCFYMPEESLSQN